MTGAVLAAAGLAAAAVLSVSQGTSSRRLSARGGSRPAQLSWPTGSVGRHSWLTPAAAAALVVVLLVAPARVAVAALGLAVLAWTGRSRASSRRRAAASATGAAVAETASALAADLGAGHAPLAALAGVATEAVGAPGSTGSTRLAERLRWIAATGQLGGDVPAALRAVAREPGADALRDVAAAWQVAELTGAPLAGVLEQVARGIGARHAADRRVEVSLAGARASARVLVALPAFGVLIGAGLGVSPLEFLLGPWPGRVCLVLGLGLAALGVTWTDRLVAAAAPGRRVS